MCGGNGARLRTSDLSSLKEPGNSQLAASLGGLGVSRETYEISVSNEASNGWLLSDFRYFSRPGAKPTCEGAISSFV